MDVVQHKCDIDECDDVGYEAMIWVGAACRRLYLCHMHWREIADFNVGIKGDKHPFPGIKVVKP